MKKDAVTWMLIGVAIVMAYFYFSARPGPIGDLFRRVVPGGPATGGSPGFGPELRQPDDPGISNW